MSSHYHLVLHVDETLNENLSPEEISERWYQLYSKPVLIKRWQAELTISGIENKTALAIIDN